LKILAIAAHIISTAIFIIVLLIVLVIILVAELKKFRNSKLDHQSEQEPIIINEPKPRRSIFKKSQDAPKNTAKRINRYRQRPVDDDLKTTRQNSPIHTTVLSSTDTFRTSKAPSKIQTEYQRLLRPSSRFNLNDTVYANETDLARVIGTDG
jgi:hypothetical protein